MIQKSELKLLITPDAIAQAIAEVALKLDEEFREKEITLVMVMKGALCLAADLMRALTVPCTLEFIQASSYGQRGTTAGELHLVGLESLTLTDKHVLLVDDIYDTGNTLTTIRDNLLTKGPASLKTLVLLTKQIVRQTTYIPDFSLFTLEDQFVVGYGLDYKELYRGLKGVYSF